MSSDKNELILKRLNKIYVKFMWSKPVGLKQILNYWLPLSCVCFFLNRDQTMFGTGQDEA